MRTGIALSCMCAAVFVAAETPSPAAETAVDHGPRKTRVAIVLTAREPTPRGFTETFVEQLSSALAAAGPLSVLPAQELQSELDGTDYQNASVCATTECVSSMGYLLGVQYVVAGSVRLNDSDMECLLDLRVVDVANAVEAGRVDENIVGGAEALAYFLPDLAAAIAKAIAEPSSAPALEEEEEQTFEEVASEMEPETAARADSVGAAKEAAVSQREAESVSAEPAYGTLVIDGTPRDAHVYLNDRLVGKMPYRDDRLPEGTYTIRIEADGYGTHTRVVKVEPGVAVEIEPELKPIYASLSVVTVPPGATFFVNNVLTGETPDYDRKYDPETYRVRIEKDGYKTHTTEVDLLRNRHDTLEVMLVPSSGSRQKPGPPPQATSEQPARDISKPIRLAGFGVVAVGGVVSGILLDRRIKRLLDDEEEIYAEYMAATDQSTMDRKYKKYLSASESTDRVTSLRNFTYMLSAGGVLGFWVSVFF